MKTILSFVIHCFVRTNRNTTALGCNGRWVEIGPDDLPARDDTSTHEVNSLSTTS